jgi:hypothetical protein
MAWFKCFIRGENFPGELVQESGLIGFYVTRFVEAASAEEAESVALAVLRANPRLAAPVGYPSTSATARIFFEDITEVDADDVPSPQPGFAFYPM